MKIIITDKAEYFDTEKTKDLSASSDIVFTKLDTSAYTSLDSTIYKSEVVLAPDPEYFNWEINHKFLDKFEKIKAICLPTTSYKCLDLKYCSKRNIVVTNNPNYSTEAVAEYAIWMMLSLARRLPLLMSRKNNTIIQDELKGKIAGIVGLGSIGNRIAKHCDRMGMKALYWSRSKKDTFFEKVSVEKLLSRSDVVFPCYSINSKTKNLLDDEKLKLLKESAYFVSILGKNGYDNKYLKKRLYNSKLSGLAYESKKEWKTKRKANLFTPPPVAWHTQQSRKRCYSNLIDTIISVVEGNPINVVSEKSI